MNSRLRIVALSLAIGYTVCQLFVAAPALAAATFSASDISAAVNTARQTNGLSALRVSSELTAAAQDRAHDMVTRNYFAHESPDGLLPWDVALAHGYDYRVIGENLATNWLSAAATMNAWMTSPAHRENILNPAYVDTGVAAINANGKIIVVQLFGASATEHAQPVAMLKKIDLPPAPAEVTIQQVAAIDTVTIPEVTVAEIVFPVATLYRADAPTPTLLNSQPFLLDQPFQLFYTEKPTSTVLGASIALPTSGHAAGGEGLVSPFLALLCGSLILIGASLTRRVV